MDNRALTALILILAKILRAEAGEDDDGRDYVPAAVRLVAEREAEVLNLYADSRRQQ